MLLGFNSIVCAGSDGKVILAFGDSLTAGLGLPPGVAFPAQLEERLRSQGLLASVINGGISGDTTADGLARLDRALAERPNLVILELGTNDALRGVQPAIARANLQAIIRKIKAVNATILLTGVRAPSNWGEEYRLAFNRIYPETARAYRIPLYPFFLEGVAEDRDLNQPDGLHPNRKGISVLGDRLEPIVLHLLQGLLFSPGDMLDRTSPESKEILVATSTGLVAMTELEYENYVKTFSELPNLSKSYIFGRSIPRPKTDKNGYIRVLNEIGPESTGRIIPKLGDQRHAR